MQGVNPESTSDLVGDAYRVINDKFNCCSGNKFDSFGINQLSRKEFRSNSWNDLSVEPELKSLDKNVLFTKQAKRLRTNQNIYDDENGCLLLSKISDLLDDKLEIVKKDIVAVVDEKMTKLAEFVKEEISNIRESGLMKSSFADALNKNSCDLKNTVNSLLTNHQDILSKGISNVEKSVVKENVIQNKKYQI